MSRLPRINPRDLRDHADQARIDRIWGRIQRDLPAVEERGRELASRERAAAAVPVRPRRSPRAVLLWAACLGGVFAAGLFVGSSQLELTQAEGPEASAVDAPLSDVFAAGTRQRTFALPGGGRLVLQPESLVEVVEVRDGSVRLHLLRGRAAVDASMADMSFAIVAGEAMALAPAGSVVSLSRMDTDVDVAVDAGSVEVVSPTGRRMVRRGETSRVPIIASVSATDDATSPHVVASQPPRHPTDRAEEDRSTSNDTAPPDGEVVAVAPAQPEAPSWLALFEKDKYDDATRALEKQGGISQAITSAQSARELMALWELAGPKRSDLAIAALKRVADDFSSDPNATIAATTLADAYERMGKKDDAAKYRAQAMKSGRLEEPLLCRQLSDTPRDSVDSRRKAKALALEYIQRFKDGTCVDLANAAIEDASADGDEKGDVPPDAGTSSEKPADKAKGEPGDKSSANEKPGSQKAPPKSEGESK